MISRQNPYNIHAALGLDTERSVMGRYNLVLDRDFLDSVPSYGEDTAKNTLEA